MEVNSDNSSKLYQAVGRIPEASDQLKMHI